MRLFIALWLAVPALVIGCRPSVVIEGTPVAAGESSAGATSGGAVVGVATETGLVVISASSSGVGGAPTSVSAAATSGGGGAPAVASSATTGGSGGAPSLATSASSSGVGGSTAQGSSAVATGAGGAGGAVGAVGAGGSAGGSPAVTCPLCSDALNDFVSPDAVCPTSQTKYLAVVECACKAACGAVCGLAGSLDCLASWHGNAPPDCAACLASASGCLTVWDDCIGDDGVSTTVDTVDTPP